MSEFKLPKNIKRTSGLTVLEGKLHAVRYIWEEGLTIKELADKGIARVKSGIAIEETPKQYFKSFRRGDSTGKVMIDWNDNFIHQTLNYQQAAKIIKMMDNCFKQMMKDEGFQSRGINRDRGIGTEFYESDNREELIDTIKNNWNKAYRIAYENVTKTELPESIAIQEFVPRYKQQEEMIDPVVNYFKTSSKCTIEVPGGSGKTKCSSRISQIVSSNNNAWKVLGVAPTIATTIQLCNEFSKFYKSQTDNRLMDLYFIGSANPSDYRLLESWANIYSVSNETKLKIALKKAYNSDRDCAFFVVNDSVNDFLTLTKNINVDFKNFFTIVDEIHTYSTENGRPRLIQTPACAIIDPKFDDLFDKKLGLSATHINRDETLIDDPNAVFNDDEDKFGPCVARITEIQAREWGWICDKQGLIIPIPTTQEFTDALAQNASFTLELYGKTEIFNPVTFVGVEGIKLVSYSNKILVLASYRADVADITRVLRSMQAYNDIDSDFEIIEGYAECGNACINKFNRAKRAIMIATRWIGVGADTYTCDCTLPLYNPQSRAFARQFGMRGDRKYEEKVTTFCLVGAENQLEDSPFWESLQMISNGEQLEIISESEIRQARQRTTGGRGNITLVRPDRPIPTTIFAQWEEIAKHVAARNYVDENGNTLFSQIVYGNINYTPELILEFVKEQGYTKKNEWQECREGNKYYSNAHKLECLDWVVEQAGLDYKNKAWTKEDYDILFEKYQITTRQDLENAALQEYGRDTIMTTAVTKGWYKAGDLGSAKSGRKSFEFTPKNVKQWFTDNNFIGKPINEAQNLLASQNKSLTPGNGQKLVKLYNKFLKENKIEKLLFDSRANGSRTLKKHIMQLDKQGNVIKIWGSSELNASEFNRKAINHILKGRGKSSQGFSWKYKE